MLFRSGDAAVEACEKFEGMVGSKTVVIRVLEGVGRWITIEAPQEVGDLIQGSLEE